MGDSTSFTALMAEPTSKKIFLAELNLAEELTGWTLTAAQTYTYEISFLNETITLADSTTENIRKAISSLEEDGTALTEKTSIATVEAISGSYWHDTANSKLYMHPSGDDSPALHTILGFFWLYFATDGVILNSIYYEPYIAENGIPGIRQSNPNLYWGIAQISEGILKFLNGRGYFDQISKKFIWTNKKCRILLGGDNLAYGEYQLLYTFRITNKRFTREEFALDIASESFNLMRSIPINKFLISNYPSLDPIAEGKPIPIYYGEYSSTHAPTVTCINSAYGADQYQFKICDHCIESFDEGYVNYDDGAGWSTITIANTNSTLGTFTVTDSSFVLGESKIKVAFHGKSSAAGSSAIESAPAIIQDLLINVLSYTTSNLESTSFQESSAESENVLNVPIEKETETLSIIEQICQSDLAFFDSDENGKFRYRTWRPYIASTYPEIDDTDCLNIPEFTEDNKQIYSTVSIGYAYSCANNSYKFIDNTQTETQYKYDRNEQLQIKSYLRTQSDAITLAQRLSYLTKTPTVKLRTELKLPIIDKLLGDKIQLTIKRAPTISSSGYENQIFEIDEKEISCFPFINKIEAFDLKDFGGNIGYWTSVAAPNWSTASNAQKRVAGYWSDSSGYIDPTDSTSLNQSLWW